MAGGDFVPQTEGVLLHSSNEDRSFIRERRRNDQQEIERERNQLTRYVSVKQVGEGRYARQELNHLYTAQHLCVKLSVDILGDANRGISQL